MQKGLLLLQGMSEETLENTQIWLQEFTLQGTFVYWLLVYALYLKSILLQVEKSFVF